MQKNVQTRREDYQRLVEENKKKPPVLRNVILAFLIGGAICLVGQIVLEYFSGVERTQDEAVAITLAAMIFLGSVLTGLGVYDSIGEIGGAGAAVPITGFANTIVAAAMEFKREGYLLGMASKMFIIAGPVLVYGILAGFITALIKAAFLGYFN